MHDLDITVREFQSNDVIRTAQGRQTVDHVTTGPTWATVRLRGVPTPVRLLADEIWTVTRPGA